MSGGISQLVATGAQDVHLVGDPQVSFFRSNYKRHTNFSAVRARQVIQGGNTDAAASGMSTVRFEKKGDLLSYTYLTKKSGTDTIAIGSADIKYVELYIGGQLIDTQYSDYSTTQWPSLEGDSYAKSQQSGIATNFYPLHFFFCDNWTNALPLVALQYHDVEIRIYWDDTIAAGTFECWSNFIYLDEAERSYFAENTQNMLIKQVQRSLSSAAKVQNFNFNHPVLYIGTAETGQKTSIGADTTASLQFNINGVQSGEEMNIDPHFTTVPGFNHSPACYDSGPANAPLCIPFALNLTSYQPSGSLNFSRLDSSRLEVMTAGATFTADMPFYAVNWNVLKIENGMGGLMYSN